MGMVQTSFEIDWRMEWVLGSIRVCYIAVWLIEEKLSIPKSPVAEEKHSYWRAFQNVNGH